MASLQVARCRSGEEIDLGSDTTWGATFMWSRYSPSVVDRRPHHCVFCWATFVESGVPEPTARVEGYMTSTPLPGAGDDGFWVCDSCFSENRDEFAWQVAQTNAR